MKQGFSLVELSIVLVVLGLLTGGILTGQNLIRSAELRAVTTEFQQFQTAINSFRDKYWYLPGDMPNATDFWGSAGGNGTDATCQATDSGDSTTCGGNGNGFIVRDNETHRAWQHLANAGLIAGNYRGTDTFLNTDGDLEDSVPGENIPLSRAGNNIGWDIQSMNGEANGNMLYFDGTYGNMLSIGGGDNSNRSNLPFLTPEEAWNIDKKIDDGQPARGKVVMRHDALYDDCTDGAAADPDHDDLDATYQLTNSSVACHMVFRQAF